MWTNTPVGPIGRRAAHQRAAAGKDNPLSRLWFWFVARLFFHRICSVRFSVGRKKLFDSSFRARALPPPQHLLARIIHAPSESIIKFRPRSEPRRERSSERKGSLTCTVPVLISRFLLVYRSTTENCRPPRGRGSLTATGEDRSSGPVPATGGSDAGQFLRWRIRLTRNCEIG
jgi:hypothetical protein